MVDTVPSENEREFSETDWESECVLFDAVSSSVCDSSSVSDNSSEMEMEEDGDAEMLSVSENA